MLRLMLSDHALLGGRRASRSNRESDLKVSPLARRQEMTRKRKKKSMKMMKNLRNTLKLLTSGLAHS